MGIEGPILNCGSCLRIGRRRGNGKAVVAAAARMLHVAYLILKERREYHE